ALHEHDRGHPARAGQRDRQQPGVSTSRPRSNNRRRVRENTRGEARSDRRERSRAPEPSRGVTTAPTDQANTPAFIQYSILTSHYSIPPLPPPERRSRSAT